MAEIKAKKVIFKNRDGEYLLPYIEDTGGGLPVFASIWSDHLYNDASYLRADTFSWHTASIYVTGYDILLEEYNNENCVEEVENGITYKRSPNGFKIASVEQHENIRLAYETLGIAWYYILDTENQRFKLPRTKYGFTGIRDNAGNNVKAGLPNIEGELISNLAGGTAIPSSGTGALKSSTEAVAATKTGSGNHGTVAYHNLIFNASDSNPIYGNSDTVQPPATQMYLYFYVGKTKRPQTEVDLGVLTEKVNDLDLDVAVTTINTAKNTGLEEITGASTTGLASVTNAVTTGLNEINTITTEGKQELQQIIIDKVPLATLDNAGLVKPDGETITIVDGIISSAGGGGGFEAVKGTNSGYIKHTESGILIQWGAFTVKASETVKLTFPTPFTTTNIGVAISQDYETYAAAVTSITTTGISIKSPLTAVTGRYIVIGY